MLLFSFGDEMSACDIWKFFAHLLIARTDIADILRKGEQKDEKHLDLGVVPTPLN